MAVEPPDGEDGLRFLCSKYSALITRLQEETLARRRADEEAQVAQRKLRDAEVLHAAERAQWETERHALRGDLNALLQMRPGAPLSAATNRDHREEAARTMQAMLKQSEELVRLRRERTELETRHRDLYAELISCRETVTQLRRSIAELEGVADAEAQGRRELDERARRLQEELRAALRKGAAARDRERDAAELATRGEREVRSRDERLAAVRIEGQRYARRAASAERRLGECEDAEARAEHYYSEVRELQRRLRSETHACEVASLQAARAEAGEARTTALATDAHNELRAREQSRAATRERAQELQAELGASRALVERLEADWSAAQGTLIALREECREEQRECGEAARARDGLTAELARTRRRLDAMSLRRYTAAAHEDSEAATQAAQARAKEAARMQSFGSTPARASGGVSRRGTYSSSRSAGLRPKAGGGSGSLRGSSRVASSSATPVRSCSAGALSGRRVQTPKESDANLFATLAAGAPPRYQAAPSSARVGVLTPSTISPAAAAAVAPEFQDGRHSADILAPDLGAAQAGASDGTSSAALRQFVAQEERRINHDAVGSRLLCPGAAPRPREPPRSWSALDAHAPLQPQSAAPVAARQPMWPWRQELQEITGTGEAIPANAAPASASAAREAPAGSSPANAASAAGPRAPVGASDFGAAAPGSGLLCGSLSASTGSIVPRAVAPVPTPAPSALASFLPSATSAPAPVEPTADAAVPAAEAAAPAAVLADVSAQGAPAAESFSRAERELRAMLAAEPLVLRS
eukprot:TRINITY_DN9397_c0_g2_i4.p1 TRINITY_DN9397_c0_g2~~TRINITY_DN9397_c0_g2_i4.p1  ORF type:complete len:766 (+),score=180.09 TRINITY_DN9397_c0_g2_i4:376-2673(+)